MRRHASTVDHGVNLMLLGRSGTARTFTSDQCDAVRDLDPLGADALCAAVPVMNAQADVSTLARTLRSLVPTATRISDLSKIECLAAMRDLGILLGSLKRQGVEPVSVVPEVEAALSLLGERTQMVPRDTVCHYGPWNPPGPRQRMYLGSPQEDALIRSVRLAIPEVDSAIPLLVSLLDTAPQDPTCAVTLRQSAVHLEAMVRAIDLVRSEVTADYFARVMRPYFEPISVAGTAYWGPAAAHMPMYLIDSLLWSADHRDAAHQSFQHESIAYGPPCWRDLFAMVGGRTSITTRVVEAISTAAGEPTPGLRESVDALCSLYRVLITFRGRHTVLARAAYQTERRLYVAGSGGGTVQLLEQILKLTRDYASALRPTPAAASDAGHTATRRPVQP
jgi:hypothetical protein